MSLQPFTHPVSAADGTIFDLTHILPWLKKHGTNPVTGLPLKSAELIKLHFAKNDEGELVDPVTFKVFTNNTHIVALKNTGNVFAYDTIERLNIKPKMWKDLVSDTDFDRKDIVTLQDPQNIEARNLGSFKYLQDGVSTLTEDQQRERNDPSRNVNKDALGNAARILKAKQAVSRSRAERDPNNPNPNNPNHNPALPSPNLSTVSAGTKSLSNSVSHLNKPVPYNAAQHTTGKAAASFTSTGLTPHTSAERALLTDEEYMLKPRRVKQKGYARITTSLGELNVELQPEFAPRAVWNFVHLAKKGYYNGIVFHRNIRNFMIQGGDPTGTGKGGQSIWGKNFQDEFDGPATHDARGIVSMANKGKNTNSSQFFIIYRPAKHLDRKHTIFGKVVGGLETLGTLENAPVSDDDKRPIDDIVIQDVSVFVDPFEEFQKAKKEKDDAEMEREEIRRMGGTEDDRTTWTGKRIRGAGTPMPEDQASVVGKYMNGNVVDDGGDGDGIVEEWESEAMKEPVKKKSKVGNGFGNFDSW